MKGLHRSDTSVRQHFALTKSNAVKFNTKLLYAGKLQRSKHWKEVLHSHEFCEIIYILSGMGKVQIGETVYSIKKGDLLVYHPNVPHMEYTEGKTPLEMEFFGITGLELHQLAPDHLLPGNFCPVIHTGDSSKKFELYFQSLVDETESVLAYSEVISGYWAKLILTSILRLINVSERTLVKNMTFSRIHNYLTENFAKIESIEYVCNELYVSKYYLSHVFKKYTGISPMQYVAQCRISHAKKLLEETDLSAREISERCGYEDCTVFFKTFRRLEGMTPIGYRNDIRRTEHQDKAILSEAACTQANNAI